MTPKIYDEVSSKLFTIWGEFAGWAHSVSIPENTMELRRSSILSGALYSRSQNILYIWRSNALGFTLPYEETKQQNDHQPASPSTAYIASDTLALSGTRGRCPGDQRNNIK